MSDDFSKYEAMRDAGSAPEEVYRAAIQDGVEAIARIRLTGRFILFRRSRQRK